MEDKIRVLLAEDDALLREALTDYFISKGWLFYTAPDGFAALKLLEKESFDLLLLDVMMPKLSGFSVCKQLRQSDGINKGIPIIFLTARAMEEDMLNGYALGADDYITKPFSQAVLYAKATALLNRTITKDTGISILKNGGITLNENTKEVFIREKPISLAPMEYDILLFFMKNKELIFTRDQLLIRFWGYDFSGNDRVVDNHIKKLRKALLTEGSLICTARKSGYYMRKEP